MSVRFSDELGGVVSEGGGPPVLWLHGYTLDSSSYREIWGLLPEYRHVGVDLPGHGSSSPLPPGSTLVDLAAQLFEVCAREGIRRVIALSFGTPVGLQLALQFPDAFDAVVLAAPTIAGAPGDPSMVRPYQRMGMLRMMAGRSPELDKIWFGSPAWNGLDGRPGLRELVEGIVRRHTFEELLDMRRMGVFRSPVQTDEALAAVKARLLVVHGSREMDVFRQCAERLERVVPGARREILDGVDHLCLLQAPEASAQLIREHLR